MLIDIPSIKLDKMSDSGIVGHALIEKWKKELDNSPNKFDVGTLLALSPITSGSVNVEQYNLGDFSQYLGRISGMSEGEVRERVLEMKAWVDGARFANEWGKIKEHARAVANGDSKLLNSDSVLRELEKFGFSPDDLNIFYRGGDKASLFDQALQNMQKPVLPQIASLVSFMAKCFDDRSSVSERLKIFAAGIVNEDMSERMYSVNQENPFEMKAVTDIVDGVGGKDKAKKLGIGTYADVNMSYLDKCFVKITKKPGFSEYFDRLILGQNNNNSFSDILKTGAKIAV